MTTGFQKMKANQEEFEMKIKIVQEELKTEFQVTSRNKWQDKKKWKRIWKG